MYNIEDEYVKILEELTNLTDQNKEELEVLLEEPGEDIYKILKEIQEKKD